MPDIRDRVKEFRRVPASELRLNPKNWRTHPQAQRSALRGVLAEVGFADAVLAYETADGLTLIDGHLRVDEMGEREVPVLVLDVTEAEADKLLLTLDPLAALAGRDEAALEQLLASVSPADVDFSAFLDDVRGVDAEDIPSASVQFDAEVQPSETKGLRHFGVMLSVGQYEQVTRIVQQVVDSGECTHPDNNHKTGNALWRLLCHAEDGD